MDSRRSNATATILYRVVRVAAGCWALLSVVRLAICLFVGWLFLSWLWLIVTPVLIGECVAAIVAARTHSSGRMARAIAVCLALQGELILLITNPPPAAIHMRFPSHRGYEIASIVLGVLAVVLWVATLVVRPRDRRPAIGATSGGARMAE